MRTLVRFAALLLHGILAFVRSRREQASLNLALQQQLAVYAQKRHRAEAVVARPSFLGCAISALATMEESPVRSQYSYALISLGFSALPSAPSVDRRTPEITNEGSRTDNPRPRAAH